MASFGTPYEGRDNIIGPSVYVGLDLRLYTNAKSSLGPSSVLADLTHPTGTGYATFTLTDSWSFTNGVVTYNPVNPEFTNSGGVDWTGAVTGAAITDGTYLLHFKDFVSDPITVVPAQTIEVDVSTLVF